MGYLAAVLSTPCSFGILAAVFAWAQTQHWGIATITIMLIGVGMSGLEPESGSGQFAMFEGSSPEEEKWDRVERAVDSILDRFGQGAVRKGRQLE